MARLTSRAAQLRWVSDQPGPNYAPAVFAKEPDNGGFTKEQFEASMERLFKAGKIRVEVSGPKSRQRRKIVVVNE